MRPAEVKELAAYLRVPIKNLRGPFKVVEASCPHCDRHITFLDFVKTGIEEGPHNKSQLGAVLAGQAGAWLTIRGAEVARSCVQPAMTSSPFPLIPNTRPQATLTPRRLPRRRPLLPRFLVRFDFKKRHNHRLSFCMLVFTLSRHSFRKAAVFCRIFDALDQLAISLSDDCVVKGDLSII